MAPTTQTRQPMLSRPNHMTLTESTAETIREAIHQGKFPVGSQLPSEKELIEMLSVSRTTVREALRILEEQGLIIRRRGLGRYVSQRSILKDLSINFGISEMITQAGFQSGTQAAKIYTEKASAQIAEALQIDEGASVLILDRVRTADNQPVVWSKDILVSGMLGDHLPEVFDFEHQSLYAYLQSRARYRVTHGTAKVSPAIATQEIASKLNVRRGSALLIITQIDYDDNDQPIIYSIEYHVPDKFVFVIHRKGPDS